MSGQVSIQSESPLQPAATQLVRELSAELAHRYADLGDDGYGAFTPNDALVPRSTFLVARLNGQPVGCGALRPMDAQVAEIKRMYVATSARRRGIAGRLLAELERAAVGFGYQTLRLETGNRQAEAIALYERSGFHRIPPFGRYVGNPLSICFEKTIAG